MARLMWRHRRITNTVTARLHLESHARSSTSMPLFFSSDTVRGRLEIEVKHEVKIKEIKLVVGLLVLSLVLSSSHGEPLNCSGAMSPSPRRR
jgi:hypothetical protein